MYDDEILIKLADKSGMILAWSKDDHLLEASSQ